MHCDRDGSRKSARQIALGVTEDIVRPVAPGQHDSIPPLSRGHPDEIPELPDDMARCVPLPSPADRQALEIEVRRQPTACCRKLPPGPTAERMIASNRALVGSD